jgi:outer membrane protein assembly factor BamB
VLAVALAAAACDGARTTSGPAPPSSRAPSAAVASKGAPTAEAKPNAEAKETAAARANGKAEAAACAATAWSMYGHDPARTSVSDGCVDGPLAIRWKITRKGTCGFKFRPGRFVDAVGDGEALFAAVDCGGSPAMMRVSHDGEMLWTFSRADYGRGSWPAIASEGILAVDDGVFLVDRDKGTWHGRELDVWGEPLVVGDTYYVDNTFQLDGSGPFVGAFDASLKWKWRASFVSVGKGKSVARTGGIAYADGLVVHSAAVGARYVPSLAAHDAATGDRRWVAENVWPESAPSIAGGRVFTMERWLGEKGDRLVARSLADGSVVWSQTTAWARGPSPVVTDALVIVHGAEGVRAHDRATGALVWSSPTPRKAPFETSATTMAVANGSRTIVVTSGPRIVVLALADGAEKWSGAVVRGSSDTAPGGATIERPIVIGRSVYATSDGALVRLDPAK